MGLFRPLLFCRHLAILWLVRSAILAIGKYMIESQNDRQPLRSNSVGTKSRATVLWQTVPFALFFIAGIIYSSYSDVQQRSLLRQYQTSPNCVSGSPILSTLSPCIRTPMQITDKQFRPNVKVSHNGYGFTLRTAGGKTEEVSLHGHTLWDQVRVGDTITAKSWRGKIVTVTAYGYSTMTYSYPTVDIFIYRAGVTLCTIWLIIIGLYIFRAWRKRSEFTGVQC